jgi:hypothetical protein
MIATPHPEPVARQVRASTYPRRRNESTWNRSFERITSDVIQMTVLKTSRNVRRSPKRIRVCFGTGWRSLPTALELIGRAAPNLTPKMVIFRFAVPAILITAAAARML